MFTGRARLHFSGPDRPKPPRKQAALKLGMGVEAIEVQAYVKPGEGGKDLAATAAQNSGSELASGLQNSLYESCLGAE